MATPEQKAASKKVHDAVDLLNAATGEAGAVGLFVDLQMVHEFGRCNPRYVAASIEFREQVLP